MGAEETVWSVNVGTLNMGVKYGEKNNGQALSFPEVVRSPRMEMT